MDSVGIFLVLVAIVGTAVQGGSCMFTKERPLSVGFLDLCLCILIVFLTIFLCSGALVIAPEFGMIMVQGAGATWFLRLALAIVGALPIICWCRIRELNHSQVNMWPYIVAGIGVGVWAATRVHCLNPNDLEPLRVLAYDVWWPPLAVWLVYCLANIMLALAATSKKTLTASFGLGAALVAPLGRFALVHQELFDPQSRAFWTILEPGSLLLAMVFVARRYSDLGFVRRRPRLALAGFILVGILLGSIFAVAGNTTKLIIDLILPVVLLSSNFLAIFVLIAGPGNAEEAEQPKRKFFVQLKHGLSSFSSGYRLSGVIAAVSVLIIPACLIDVFSIGALDRDLEFGILTFFWLSFSAKLATGVIHALPQLFKHGVPHLPIVETAWKKSTDALSEIGKSIKGAGASFITGKFWDITVRSIIVTVFALLALVAVGEILNYGKLVVEPFEWKGEGEDKAKVADRVGAGVVNTLGEMRRELLPVLIIGAPADPHAPAGRVQPAVMDNGAVEAAVAKGTDLKLSDNVQIPLALLTSPLQRIIQWTFNIRVVRGTLHTTSDGKHYIVLIDSDKGDTWKIYGDIPATAEEDAAKKATDSDTQEQGAKGKGQQAAEKSNDAKSKDAKAKDTKAANAKAQPADPDAKTKDAVEQGANDANSEPQSDGLVCKLDQGESNPDPLDKLISEAAFRIASSDPSFVTMGLTRNWPAYTYFHIGLQRWNCYQAYKHWSDLETAIDFFRKSVQEDSTFAPAEYRLGIAMKEAGEPDGAIQAFKNSLDANPTLVESRTAEAETLASYDVPYYSPAAISDYPLRPDRNVEARRVLAAVIAGPFEPANLLDVVQAYFGLCSNRFETEDQDYGIYTNKLYLAYFYCSRAQALYYRLPQLGRNDLARKKLEASILSALGDVLNGHDPDKHAFPLQAPTDGRKGVPHEPETMLWVCSNSAIDNLDLYKNGYPTQYFLHGSRLTGHALRYFRQSVAFIPNDDYVLCSEATAAAYLAKDRKSVMRAMQRLESSAAAHLYLGSTLFDQARQNAHGHLDYSRDPDFQAYVSKQPSFKSYEEINNNLAQFYYVNALREFEWAISLSPTDPDALDEYANTVWSWSLDEKMRRAGKYQSLYYSTNYRWEAESRARESIRQSRLRNHYADQLNAMDTLGEVLLTLGRNEEALDVLRKLSAAQYDFYGYDEFQWDFAQASICAANSERGPGAALRIRDAEDALAGIERNERNREMRLISTTPGALDPMQGQARCFAPPDLPASTYDLLSFSGTTYESWPGCSRMVLVEAKFQGALPHADFPRVPPGVDIPATPPGNATEPPPAETKLALHIWGNGVEEFNRSEGLTIELVPPAFGHRIYFAQLADSTTALHSPIISFDVLEDKNDLACPHGHVILNFKPLLARPAQPPHGPAVQPK